MFRGICLSCVVLLVAGAAQAAVIMEDFAAKDFGGSTNLTIDTGTFYSGAASLELSPVSPPNWPSIGIKDFDGATQLQNLADPGMLSWWCKTTTYTRAWDVTLSVWDGSGITPVASGTPNSACITDGQWHQMTFTMTKTAAWDLNPTASSNYLSLSPTGTGYGGFWGDYSVHIDKIEWTPEPTTLGLLALGACALLRRKRG